MDTNLNYTSGSSSSSSSPGKSFSSSSYSGYGYGSPHAFPPPIDPFNQTLTLLLPNGIPMHVALSGVQNMLTYGIEESIVFGSQVGASLVLLVVLLILTRPEKRQSAIFVLNVLALFVNAVHCILQCAFFDGPFYDIYRVIASDYKNISRAVYANQIADLVMILLLTIFLEASLFLQTRVICVTLPNLHKAIVTALTAVVALVAIGFCLALAIENSRYILALRPSVGIAWLVPYCNITFTVSVCLFSLIFVAKLGVAMYQRRKLGLHQYGPIQVVFIMGCQTLCVPAIVSVLQYVTTIPEIATVNQTVIALFLPLSAIWASTTSAGQRASFGSEAQRRFFGISDEESSAQGEKNHTGAGTTPTSETLSPATTLSPSIIKNTPKLTEDEAMRFCLGRFSVDNCDDVEKCDREIG